MWEWNLFLEMTKIDFFPIFAIKYFLDLVMNIIFLKPKILNKFFKAIVISLGDIAE